MTREHVFPRSWRRKVSVPAVPVEFYQSSRREGDPAIRKTGQTTPFTLVLRRVCNPCNSTWMRELDEEVENWVVNPEKAGTACDPTIFRRWATKIAILRSFIDRPNIIPRLDCENLYDGNDNEKWHIFVGRTIIPEQRDTFAGAGFIGTKPFGIMQISWSLGTALVTCLRPLDEAGDGFLKGFKGHIRSRGSLFEEVLPTDKFFPYVMLKPPVPNELILEYFWYFSSQPVSPISHVVADLERKVWEANP